MAVEMAARKPSFCPPKNSTFRRFDLTKKTPERLFQVGEARLYSPVPNTGLSCTRSAHGGGWWRFSARLRFIRQVRRQPPFDLRDRHPLSGGVVFDLVLGDHID